MTGRILFDPENARGPSDRPDVGEDVTTEFVGGAGGAPVTVSALLADVKAALADHLPAKVVVVGEISNFKRHSSNHLYFSLKDSGAQIAAVMFRSAADKLKFDPVDGLEVVVEGRVDVYELQGKLQLYVDRLTPRGQGALELAFRQLVAKLRTEGLFDPACKKPLPTYPGTLCVITSPTGAAVRDIRRTLGRRWPAATVYLLGVRVQGEGAAQEIARAVRLADANADRLGLDVLIVARGGGSIEDLWAFNEECVARALFDCRVPVISGVGHEVDTTIADMVADVRAATPTAAAECATPDRDDLRRLLGRLAGRLERNLVERYDRGVAALKLVRRSEFFRNPLHRLAALTQQLDEAATAIQAALTRRHVQGRSDLRDLQTALRWHLGALARQKADRLAERRARLAAVHPAQRVRLGLHDVEAHRRQLITLTRAMLAARAARVDRCDRTLEALSYRNVLRRGYSVTRDLPGRLLRRTTDISPRQTIRTELADGEIRSVVTGPPGATGRRSPKQESDQEPTLF